LIQEAIAEANSARLASPEARYTALADSLLRRGLEKEGMQAIDAARQARLNEIEEQQKRLGIKKTQADVLAQEALAEQRKKVKDAKTVSERNRNFITDLEVKLRDGGELTTAELVKANVLNEQERRDKTYIDKDTKEEVTIVGFDINAAAPMLAAALKKMLTERGSTTNGKPKEVAPATAQDGRRAETRETPESLKIKQGFRAKIQDSYDTLASNLGAVPAAFSAITPSATGWGWTFLNPNTGILGFVPATDARALANYLEPIKSGVIMQAIQEMKAQSRTGATGLGQITEKEIGILERLITALDPADRNFPQQLKLVYKKYVELLDRLDRDMKTHGGKLVKQKLPPLKQNKNQIDTTPSPATTQQQQVFGTSSGVVQDLTQSRFTVEEVKK